MSVTAAALVTAKAALAANAVRRRLMEWPIRWNFIGFMVLWG